MYNLEVTLHHYKGEKRSKGSFNNYSETQELVLLETEEIDGVSCVSVNAVSEHSLDPDCGVEIDIELECKEYVADYMYSEFWCKPHFGTDLAKVPEETQALIYKKADGTFGVILPVVNDNYRCTLCGKNKKTVTARLASCYTGLASCIGLAFVYAEGELVAELMERCVRVALKVLDNGIPHRSERRYPEMFEYLGWCSWDSMQIRVDHKGLVEKCEEFKEKNIPVKWAIIDDMWAHVTDFYGREYDDFMSMVAIMHASALHDFKPDPIRFPEGLASVVDDIRSYGISVGMWLPTTGYWRGIEPDSPAYAKLKDYLIETDDGIYVPDWQEYKSYMYYKTLHEYFVRSGVEFVKIDNQSMYNRFYNRLAPIGKASREFHNGMEASVGAHFDNCMINCMGMSSEDMFNRRVSSISRCSDDFKPENREWFAKHILQCSYNSLIQGQFFWCDWDMWWTDDGQAEKNSLIRAISGGPVYVSDMIGRSNAEILAPLATADGKILRCDRPAVPTADCTCTDPTTNGEGFKLQNICGDSGVVAVYNLDGKNKSVKATVSPSDVDELSGDKFVIYEHFSREFAIVDYDTKTEVVLKDNDDYKLYIIVPYVDGFAPIGRIDKYISPKTIKYVHGRDICLTEAGPYAYVADGELVISE